MSNTKTRLRTIEKKLERRDQDMSIDTIIQIDRLIYGFHENPITEKEKITMREWDKYKEHTIALAKSRSKDDIWFEPLEEVERELLRDESYIRGSGGFRD